MFAGSWVSKGGVQQSASPGDVSAVSARVTTLESLFGGQTANALAVLGIGTGSDAPVLRMRKGAANEAAWEIYSDESGTPRRRASIVVDASEGILLRVYAADGTTVTATWTFFSDGDTSIPGSFLLGSAQVRFRTHASASPAATFSGQPTSPYYQRDSGRRWFKKQATDTTGWTPEISIPPQTQTTDATVTTIDSLTLADNSAIQLDVQITAKVVGSAVARIWHIKCAGRRSGGGSAVQVGTAVDLTGGTIADAGLATAAVTVVVSSNSLLVRAAGVVATTIVWNVVTRYSEVRDTP